MEFSQNTAPVDADIAEELKKREPIFHRPEFGTTRKDFEKMTEETFREVGASGKMYSRNFILNTLEKRFSEDYNDSWQVKDFNCTSLAENVYLATYTLLQGKDRTTRRSTIWKKSNGDWKIVYHQGTIVQ